ncbi:hypothetical protein MAPG_11322 [Magnaporthiopsis poae ATCC 64411]|uniref:Uncharacterized protein n=1 Tax=Magnaporthiopsis poae (strain ATCC 64411 / 73-15) TaxID=644358 RepID=A0A0C4EEZ0_MAGP6|nr:hypothetical protein MAPG_11322 [Magnaporthiopsis poae ATCC 64411]
MRTWAMRNLFLWENLWGSSVTTHPAARYGLLYSAVDGGRSPDGSVVLTLSDNPNIPWECDHETYFLPSPRDVLVGVRYGQLIADGGAFAPYPKVHTRHATASELAEVNEDLVRMGQPAIRNRGSVMSRANYVTRLLPFYNIAPGRAVDPNVRLRLLQPAVPWVEVPDELLEESDSDDGAEKVVGGGSGRNLFTFVDGRLVPHQPEDGGRG